MVTSPVASIVTGVLAAFFLNLTVTFEGMFTVVKLKTPLASRGTVVVLVKPDGLNAPSAPVLPLSKAKAADGNARHKIKAKRMNFLVLNFTLLYFRRYLFAGFGYVDYP